MAEYVNTIHLDKEYKKKVKKLLKKYDVKQYDFSKALKAQGATVYLCCMVCTPKVFNKIVKKLDGEMLFENWD